jgi:serine/threonine-protein kinase
MSYCVNPLCLQPKNSNDVKVCQSCGQDLLLHNRYRVLGILGKGGFGATFAAADLSVEQTPICVVKQLKPDIHDPNVFKMAKQLFEREAQTLKIVGKHPQIPSLLNFFESSQQFYLVQEYVKGLDLHQEVKRNGPFTEAGVQQFLSELLPIMQYVHDQKVIHRDIKPANLIRRQTDSKLILIDFGAVKTQVNTVIAANTSENTALTNFVVGTAGFAPPEQLAQRPIFASDIFAIGVTCLYLLTGKTPKDFETDPHSGELNWRHLVDVSDSFAAVLHKMMELSVKHRYKSTYEVLDALAIAPYDEGMRQGLLTNPNTKQVNDAQKISAKTSPQSLPAGQVMSPSTIQTQNTIVQIGTKKSNYASSPSDGRVGSRKNYSGTIASKSMDNARLVGGDVQGTSGTKFTTNSFLAAYKQGQRDFAQLDLRGLELVKVVLPQINCYESRLNKCVLQESDLTNANFGHANLSFANLKQALLGNAYLHYANLESADLRGTNLTGANLKFANLKGANLCGANLTGALVTEEQLSLAKTNWLTVMPSGKRGFW